MSSTINQYVTSSKTSDELIVSIKTSVIIHKEMFLRLINDSRGSEFSLVELLEDVGNIYLNYSEILSAAIQNSKVE